MGNQAQIKQDIAGESGKGPSDALALAIESLTNWPVQAFSADFRDDETHSVTWIDGDVVGQITATGDYDEPEMAALIYPLSAVKRVQVVPKYIDSGSRTFINRTITIEFGPRNDAGKCEESITVNAGSFGAGHKKRLADTFITQVLRSLARHPSVGRD